MGPLNSQAAQHRNIWQHFDYKVEKTLSALWWKMATVNHQQAAEIRDNQNFSESTFSLQLPTKRPVIVTCTFLYFLSSLWIRLNPAASHPLLGSPWGWWACCRRTLSLPASKTGEKQWVLVNFFYFYPQCIEKVLNCEENKNILAHTQWKSSSFKKLKKLPHSCCFTQWFTNLFLGNLNGCKIDHGPQFYRVYT